MKTVFRLPCGVLIAALCAATPSLGAVSYFEGEVVARNAAGFKLDVVRGGWASYGGRPMPVLWSAGCEDGLFRLVVSFSYDLLVEQPRLTIDGKTVDRAALARHIAPGQHAVVSVDRCDVIGIDVTPFRGAERSTGIPDPLIELRLAGALPALKDAFRNRLDHRKGMKTEIPTVAADMGLPGDAAAAACEEEPDLLDMSLGEPVPAFELEAPKASKAKPRPGIMVPVPLHMTTRDLVVRFDPQTGHAIAWPGQVRGGRNYPSHAVRLALRRRSVSDGAVKLAFTVTVLPTFSNEPPDPLQRDFTVDVSWEPPQVESNQVPFELRDRFPKKTVARPARGEGSWTAKDGPRGKVTGAFLSRPDFAAENATLILRGLGRFHPNGRGRRELIGARKGMQDTPEGHFDTLAIPLVGGVGQLAGADLTGGLEFPPGKVNAVAVELADRRFSGSVSYTAEEGSFTVALDGVVCGSYAQADYVTRDASDKEVKRGTCKGRLWPVRSPPRTVPPAVAIPPLPDFAALTVKTDRDPVPGVRVQYYDRADGDRVVEEVLLPGLYHDGWIPVDKVDRDKCGLRFVTRFEAAEAGTYRFRLNRFRADKMAILTLDGKRKSWTTVRGKAKGQRYEEVKVRLPAGPVDLELDNPGGGLVDFRYVEPDGAVYAARHGPFRVAAWPGMRRRPLVVFIVTGDSHCGSYSHLPVEITFNEQRVWTYRGGRGWLESASGMLPTSASPAQTLTRVIVDRIGEVPGLHIGFVTVGRLGGGLYRYDVCPHNIPASIAARLKDATWGAEAGGLLAVYGGVGGRELIDMRNRWALIARGARDVLQNPDLPVAMRNRPCCTVKWTDCDLAYLRWEARPQHWGHEGWWLMQRSTRMAADLLPACESIDLLGLPVPLGDDHHLTTEGMWEQCRRAADFMFENDCFGRVARRLGQLPPPPANRKALTEYPVSDDPHKVLARCNARIVKISERRNAKQISPYRDAYAVFEYELDPRNSGVVSRSGFPSPRVLVVHQTVKNRKETDAFSYAIGTERKLALQTWRVQPGAERVAMDDDFQEVDTPLYFSDPVVENQNH